MLSLPLDPQAVELRLRAVEVMCGLREAKVDCSPALESKAVAAGFDSGVLEYAVYDINQSLGSPIPHEELKFITYADLVAGPAAGRYIVLLGPVNFTAESLVFALDSVPVAGGMLIALSSNSGAVSVGPIVDGQPGAASFVAGPTDGWIKYGPVAMDLQAGTFLQGAADSVARIALYAHVL